MCSTWCTSIWCSTPEPEPWVQHGVLDIPGAQFGVPGVISYMAFLPLASSWLDDVQSDGVCSTYTQLPLFRFTNSAILASFTGTLSANLGVTWKHCGPVSILLLNSALGGLPRLNFVPQETQRGCYCSGIFWVPDYWEARRCILFSPKPPLPS